MGYVRKVYASERKKKMRKKTRKGRFYLFSVCQESKNALRRTPQMLFSRGFCLPSERAATGYFPH